MKKPNNQTNIRFSNLESWRIYLIQELKKSGYVVRIPRAVYNATTELKQKVKLEYVVGMIENSLTPDKRNYFTIQLDFEGDTISLDYNIDGTVTRSKSMHPYHSQYETLEDHFERFEKKGLEFDYYLEKLKTLKEVI
jgi:hypothetical protein